MPGVENWRWVVGVGVLLLAAGLRFYLIDNQSFWNDEGNSARLSERSIRLIVEGTASDIHPPLYYLLLRGWRELVGESELALRLLSAFAGVVTVAATWAFVRSDTRGPVAPLLAGLFVAINPALVYYSQEARMYALLGLWAVLSSWLLLRWWKRPSSPIALGYILVGAAGLYTHYFFPVVLLIHGLYIGSLVLLDRADPKEDYAVVGEIGKEKLLGPRQRLLRFIGMGLLILLLYTPWLPIFLDQFSSDPVTRPPLLEFFAQVATWLFWGQTIDAEGSYLLFVLIVAMLIGVATMRIRVAVLVGAMILLPIVFTYMIGTVEPAFFKFFIISVPFVGGLLGLIAQLPRVGIWVSTLLLIALLPWIDRSLQNLYVAPEYARADYRSMAARIRAEAHPNAGIILNAPNQWEAFTYYYHDERHVYPLPRGRTRPTVEEIDAALQPIAAQHDRLYAIFWGEAQRDPERLVERWLDEHAFKATDEWVGDVRFVMYAVPPKTATVMETAVHLKFDDHITLLGYTLNDTLFRPGEIVQLTLFWQTDRPLEQRYKVFLHLYDENNQIIAQRDSEPGGGLALTPTWPVNETVRDNHGIFLPFGLEDGRYHFRLGLYDFADPNSRLSTADGDGLYLLPDIEVRK